jgi:hypothetical protein
VAPPSGRFIVQLFLVPGFIVLVAVLLLLGANYLFMGGYNADYFLRGLDSENADIRWRHANDLAQVLKRSETLKADARFALDLAARLKAAQELLARQERETADAVAKLTTVADKARAWDRVNTYRNHVVFLSGLFGEFYAPIGLPLLAESLKHEDSPDTKGHVFMRRQMLLILGTMGENIKKLERIPAPLREKMLGDLREEAQAGDERGLWARNALAYVDPATDTDWSKLTRADDVLADCAAVQDQYQREQVALVLPLWKGPRVEETLLRLSRDNGYGQVVNLETSD